MFPDKTPRIAKNQSITMGAYEAEAKSEILIQTIMQAYDRLAEKHAAICDELALARFALLQQGIDALEEKVAIFESKAGADAA